MAKKQYKITARCGNRKCAIGCAEGGVFVVMRSEVKKESTHGQAYTISQVVCPECRMWGKITNIEEAV